MSVKQREFIRWPIAGEITPADSTTLVVRGRTLACQLTEMSLGGFGVIAAQPIPVGNDDPILLKTRGLDYIVLVTYQKPCDEGMFVGLKQIEEVLPDNTASPKSPPWLMTVAWAAALSTVAAAVCCLIGMHELFPK